MDDRYYSLQNEMRNNKARQNALLNEIGNVDEKIERLKQAYRKVDEAKETIRARRSMVKATGNRYSGKWKGSKATEYFDNCASGDMFQAYNNFFGKLDEVEDAINREIYRLKTIRNEKYGIFQGLVNAWDWMCTEIQNYFN